MAAARIRRRAKEAELRRARQRAERSFKAEIAYLRRQDEARHAWAERLRRETEKLRAKRLAREQRYEKAVRAVLRPVKAAWTKISKGCFRWP